MVQMQKLFMNAPQDHLFSTIPKSFSSPKTCALQTIRTQQSLNLHNSSLTLDLERTCLLMETSRYPLISASMVPPFSHSSAHIPIYPLQSSSSACILHQSHAPCPKE